MSVFSLAILIGAYAYMWIRIRRTLFKGAGHCFVFIYGFVSFAISAVCILGTMGVSLPFGLTRPAAYAGGTMMIFVFFCDVLFLAADIVARIGRHYGWRFVQSNAYGKVGALFLVLAFLITVYGAFHAKDAITLAYDIELHGFDAQKSYTIAMVTDTHFGALYDADDLAMLVDRINEMQPDLILFVGDMVDRSHLALDNADAYRCEFNRLKAPLGVYACMGNHENHYGGNAIRQFLSNTPIMLLEDEGIVIDGSFLLIGRRDADIEQRAAMDALTDNADANLPIVVMDHQPVSLDEEQQAGVSLVLCGHTHGGQVIPLTLMANLQYEVPYGYAQKEDFHVIVSSGYGAWGTTERIGTKREIVKIELSIAP